MAYAIGAMLAGAVTGFANLIGFDRERAFYPTVLIVIASYYALFAVMAASGKTLAMESAVGIAFIVIAVLGFKANLWLVAAALAGHGLFDSIHHLLIENPGVPRWWPGFCLAFDIVAGAWLAVLLRTRSYTSQQPNAPVPPTDARS